MGDKYVAKRIGPEIVFKPVTGFKIEVVGGLIKKEKIRLGQQQFGQRNAHLPAARKLIGLPRPIFFAESQSGKHAAHLRVERVAVEGMKALLEQGVSLRRRLVLRARVVENCQLPAEPLDLPLHLMQFIEDREALVKDRSAGQRQSLLGKVADADAARLLHAAVVQRLQASDHLHQRGFAGSIGAHQRGLLLAADEPIGFHKQHPRPKPLAGILQGDHLSLFSQSAARD